MRDRSFIFLLLAELLIVSVLASGQSPTGSLRGTVTDPQGAAVAGVTIAVQDLSTDVLERTLETDQTGGFSIDSLRPAIYKLSTKKQGFASQTERIEVQIGRITVVNFKLAMGAVDQQITVGAVAVLVDPQNSVVGQVVDPEDVTSLPLNGRQFGDLAALVPGVLLAPNFDPIKTRIFNISAGGSDGRSSNFAVDGGENSDIVNGGLLQNFTVEGIQEFHVASSRFGADQGRALGAAVNVITKSGSNDFHGSYFVFYRNQALGAKDPFQAKKTDFSRAQQGFTIGGPIKKDRTFFFAAFENTNEHNLGIVNTNGIFPSFEGSFPLPFTSRLLTTKLDHHLTASQKLMVRYSFENNFSTQGIGGTRSAENGITSKNRGSDVAVSDTFVLSPTLVDVATYHYSHFHNNLLPLSLTPEVDRPDLITGGAFNTPQATLINRHQFRNDVSLYRPTGWGTHDLKLGIDYNRADVDASLEFASRGQFTFFSDAPLTNTMADLAFFSAGNFNFPKYHDNILGAYVQDDWKVKRRLTLNLGLRWDASTSENNPGFTSPLAPAGSRSKDLDNWGPRLGFAFDVTGVGKTILRGGYGIFYALPIATDPSVESAFDGRHIGFGFFSGPIDVNTPFPGLSAPQISALVFAQPQFLLLSLANHLRTPYVQETSIGVQHQLTPDMAVTIDYVHNLGLRERLGHDVNIDSAGNIGSPNTVLAQEFGPAVAASFGPVIRIDDSARSTYNALEMSVQGRFKRRIEFLGSYTLSHAVDMGDDAIGATAALPFNPNNERGDSNRDQRHKFVFSGTAHLPLRFELSTITSFATPRPYDLITGASLDGFAPTRPAGITRNEGTRDTSASIAAINAARAANGLPPITTTSPRSFFFYSTDLRLTKHFSVTDRMQVSPMVEVFNIANHVNFLSNGGPTFSGVSGAQNNIFASDFAKPHRTAGGVLGSGGPRAVQLALRVEF